MLPLKYRYNSIVAAAASVNGRYEYLPIITVQYAESRSIVGDEKARRLKYYITIRGRRWQGITGRCAYTFFTAHQYPSASRLEGVLTVYDIILLYEYKFNGSIIRVFRISCNKNDGDYSEVVCHIISTIFVS